MFDRFDTWQYRSDANCWDFVREWLIERLGVPEKDVPKYGICPNDKTSMHKAAHDEVIPQFEVTSPINGAIAAHYLGSTLYHVGVVDGNFVRHTNSKSGTRKDPIKAFERMASKTIYYTHKSLL
jgi:hypothetical protein